MHPAPPTCLLAVEIVHLVTFIWFFTFFIRIWLPIWLYPMSVWYLIQAEYMSFTVKALLSILTHSSIFCESSFWDRFLRDLSSDNCYSLLVNLKAKLWAVVPYASKCHHRKLWLGRQVAGLVWTVLSAQLISPFKLPCLTLWSSFPFFCCTFFSPSLSALEPFRIYIYWSSGS